MDHDSSQIALMERRKAYFASLNLHSGIRFRPTDKQLIGQFLIPKIRRGDAVDEEDPIKEVDAYSVEPWDLWTRFSDDDDKGADLYFYTKLKRKSSKVIERVIAGGKATWHGETAGKEIQVNYIRKDQKTKKVLSTCRLKFEIRRFSYKNPGHPEHRRWIMLEYKGVSAADWVIFRLRKTPEKTQRSR